MSSSEEHLPTQEGTSSGEQQAETCSHQDASRSGVSSTAHLVAYIRSLEPVVHKENAWFSDPYAGLLAGDVAQKAMAKFESAGEKWSDGRRMQFLNTISTRTRTIDEYVLDSVNSGAVDQILVLGAGLDTRPWRLSSTTRDLSTVPYFEVDFPEIFDYKLRILKAAGAVEVFAYKNVVADLSLPGWLNTLQEHGFVVGGRTLLIMEGFVNYLTEAELTAVVTTITEAMGAGSRLIATCRSSDSGHLEFNLHRFTPDVPIAFFTQFGWTGRQDDVEDLAAGFGRPTSPEEVRRGYFIVRAEK